MKKITKISKILLLIVTIFSYIATPVAVIANEIISMPLNMQLKAVLDENGYVDYYELTYISANNDYELEKDYEIELESTITYNDGTTETKTEMPILVDGEKLNNVRSSYKLYTDNPISRYYDYVYTLDINVYDEEEVVYTDSYSYEYSSLVGLTGKLSNVNGDVLPKDEEILGNTVGNYDVTLGEYTQNLSILTGELSPNGKYRIVYGEEDYSEIMTGEELRNEVITGTNTDLNDKLAGTYSYTDTVTIEEVKEEVVDEVAEVSVLNTYTYNYNANLKYGTDNDELFSDVYGVKFEDGYMFVDAKMEDTDTIITIEELAEALTETDTILQVFDEEGNILVSTEEGILNDGTVFKSEVKNNFTVKFINGATASYVVVVRGDANSDNFFNTEDLTNEELTGVMDEYLNNEEVNMPSMDMVTLEEEVEDSLEVIKEEFGTITFDDILFANKLLKDNMNNNEETEEDEVIENTSLVLGFGEVEIHDKFGEVADELFVGDTLRVQVLVNSANIEDYIDGIDGLVTTSENLKLSNVVFNENYIGTYNLEGRLVGVGTELTNGAVLMTLEFTAVGEGEATIELSGNISKSLTISEFATISMEDINILRKNSINNLTSLNASVGTFDVEFDKDVTVYTLTVPYETETVVLSGALEDILSQVDGLVEYELTEDKTTAIITVTAEDGSVKTYTIYIIKENPPVSEPVVYYYASSNNYLSSLEIDGYEIEFDKDTLEYKITVKNDVTSLDIRANAEDYRSRVEITGNEGFKEGKNTVTITVRSEDGSTREYKLVVDKEEKKQPVVDTESSSNTAEKVVIIILIILVVIGLLYLIFKKDDEEVENLVKEERTNNSKNNKKNNKK